MLQKYILNRLHLNYYAFFLIIIIYSNYKFKLFKFVNLISASEIYFAPSVFKLLLLFFKYIITYFKYKFKLFIFVNFISTLEIYFAPKSFKRLQLFFNVLLFTLNLISNIFFYLNSRTFFKNLKITNNQNYQSYLILSKINLISIINLFILFKFCINFI